MTAAIIAFALLYWGIHRQKQNVKRLIVSEYRDLVRIESAITDIVDLVVELIDIAGLEYDNDKKLAARVRQCFRSGNISGESLISKLPALANVYRFGIIDLLKKKSPHLSAADIEFCSLIALGVSPSAISKAMGYSHHITLYNKRVKLRKQLGLTTSSLDLESYIQSCAATLRARHDNHMKSLLEKKLKFKS